MSLPFGPQVEDQRYTSRVMPLVLAEVSFLFFFLLPVPAPVHFPRHDFSFFSRCYWFRTFFSHNSFTGFVIQYEPYSGLEPCHRGVVTELLIENSARARFVRNEAELRLPDSLAPLKESMADYLDSVGFGGGGLLVQSSFRIRSSATVLMEQNIAELIGGGAFALKRSALVTVEDSGILIISKNSGKDGGGCFVREGSACVVKSNGTLRLIENHAKPPTDDVMGEDASTSKSSGGGILLLSDSVLQIHKGQTQFESNRAGIGGGLAIGVSSRFFVGPAPPKPV